MITHAISFSELLPPRIERGEPRVRPYHAFFLALVPSIGGPIIARYFKRYAREFARQAVWYHGLRAELLGESSEEPVEDIDSMLDKLDTSLASLLDTRKLLPELKAHAMAHVGAIPAWRNPGAEFFRSCDLLAAMAADLIEEIQSFKTALLEFSADRAQRTEGLTANTPEELQKLFARI